MTCPHNFGSLSLEVFLFEPTFPLRAPAGLIKKMITLAPLLTENHEPAATVVLTEISTPPLYSELFNVYTLALFSSSNPPSLLLISTLVSSASFLWKYRCHYHLFKGFLMLTFRTGSRGQQTPASPSRTTHYEQSIGPRTTRIRATGKRLARQR